jgi:hypothetical protein
MDQLNPDFPALRAVYGTTHQAAYIDGWGDALRAALEALDGHNFNDTAHDRVRRLIDNPPWKETPA